MPDIPAAITVAVGHLESLTAEGRFAGHGPTGIIAMLAHVALDPYDPLSDRACSAVVENRCIYWRDKGAEQQSMPPPSIIHQSSIAPQQLELF